MENKTEIEVKRAKIYELKDKVRELNGKISELESEIKCHFLDEAESQFPNVKRGDKVIITTKSLKMGLKPGYDYTTHEPLFFAYSRYNRFAYEWNENGIEFVFKVPKKNGEPSAKETAFYRCNIVSMEKVEE